MKILLVLNNEEEYINIINKYNTDITYDYEETINRINSEKYICIIIDELSNINIRKLLNNYNNKQLIKNTIIIDDIKLSCYQLLDRKYQVFSIINHTMVNKDLIYYIEEIIKKNKTFNEDKANIYKNISDILKRMGISPEKDGFHYLRKAIYECFLNPSLLDNINNKLYPILSKTFHMNINSIIRSMNYAIEIGYGKSDYEYSDNIFSNTIDIDKGKPTNISFISIIVDELLLNNNITYY